MGWRRQQNAGAAPARKQRKPAKIAVTLATLLAVLIQTFVIQAHVDGLAGLGASAAIERGVSDSAHFVNAIQDEQSACPICEAMATAGVTVLSVGPILVAQVRALPRETLRAIESAPAPLAHAWQSRAPPIAL
jgi:hypothetical protein